MLHKVPGLCSLLRSSALLQPGVGVRSVLGWWACGPATPWEPSSVMTQPPSPLNVTRNLILSSVEVE